MYRLFIRVVLLLALPGLSLATPDLSKLVQLVDYVGVDYRGAVHEGQVINPAEYDEMRDFTRAIEDQARQLPTTENTPAIQTSARQLMQMVEQRQAPDAVAAAATDLRHSLIGTFNIIVVPRMAPDIQRARQLFSDNCAACHGLNGQGDGVQARGMEPAPTDFTDVERYGQRTVYGLYSTISAGVGETGMRGFSELSETDRWSLAFLVGQMATTTEARAAGKTILASQSPAIALNDLQRFTVTSPDEARAEFGAEGAELMAYLRAQPETLFANTSPLDYARDTLNASLDAYRSGQRETAYKLAVAAYLEGFELVEHRLDTVDSELRGEAETAMTAYRNLLRNDNPLSVVEAQATQVQQLLVRVTERLSEGTLSTGAAFASAFIILLREGLEAILVIAALGRISDQDRASRCHALSALRLGGCAGVGRCDLDRLAVFVRLQRRQSRNHRRRGRTGGHGRAVLCGLLDAQQNQRRAMATLHRRFGKKGVGYRHVMGFDGAVIHCRLPRSLRDHSVLSSFVGAGRRTGPRHAGLRPGCRHGRTR